MSPDKTWYCPSLDKRRWAQSTALHDFEESIYYSSNEVPSFSVSLDHGKDFFFTEVFLFLNLDDAEEFYETNFVEFEVCADGLWMGFRRIALAVDGEIVAEKQPVGEHLAVGISAPLKSALPRIQEAS